jgi:phage portal protein BeeE
VARLLSRIRNEYRGFSTDDWLQNYLLPANEFLFQGNTYGFGGNGELSASTGLVQSADLVKKTKELSATLPHYSDALRRCPPAFAAQVVRAMVLSQARFTFRRRRGVSTKRGTYGTNELSILEHPWPGATTGDLISKMEWHAGIAGNAYVYRQIALKGTNAGKPRLRVLRPDWIVCLFGSDLDPDDAALALDGELIAYLYANGGFQKPEVKPEIILPEDMAHWFPLPDPLCNSMGMSWLTPAAREMQTDGAATEHKLNFFKNGATPNLVIKGLPGVSKKAFQDAVAVLEEKHTGLANAYKTLYLAGGADATVVGSSFAEMDFSNIIGAGETRISALSRVPAIILGLSEGLRGAALNAGNFGQVRRMFGDTWIYPQLQNLSASLEPIVNVASDSELWFDVTDMPILREDATDLADIIRTQASTIASLVTNGFTRESAVTATISSDMSMLQVDTEWVSVQLQNAKAAAAGQTNNNGPDNTDPPNKNGSSPPKVGSGKNAK